MTRAANILFAVLFLLVLCGCDNVIRSEAVVCSPAQRNVIPNWVLECIRNANQMADDPEDTVQQCKIVAPELLCDRVPGFRHVGEGAFDNRTYPCTEVRTQEERDVCFGDPGGSPQHSE